MANKTSKAQLRANKKWKQKNKIKVRMSRYRTTARTFIKHYAMRQEMNELIKIFENENSNGVYPILNSIKEDLIEKIMTIKELKNYIRNTLYGVITTSILKNEDENEDEDDKYMFFYLKGVEFKLILKLTEKNEIYENNKVKIKSIEPTKYKNNI